MSAFAPYRWPAACALALATPLAVVSMPPIVDFGGHEAVVGVLRHRGDPSFFPADLYVSNWGHPNQLQYLLAWPLSYVLGTTRALEVVVAVAVASVVLGAARLARHLGKPAWTGILAAPAALGWNLHWGLVANLLGLGVLLTVLPEVDRFARSPRWADAARIVGAFALLYEAHEASLALAVVALALLSVIHGGRRIQYLVRAAPCALAVAGMLLQLRLQHLTAVNAAALEPVTVARRLSTAPWMLVGFYDYQQGRTVFEAIVLVVVLNAARALGTAPASREPPLVRARFVLFGLLLLGAYFVLPASYGGVFYLFHRFFAVAWCVLVAATAPAAGARLPRVASIAVAAAPVAMLALIARPMLASDGSYRRLDALLPRVERGSSVFSAELDHSVMQAFNREGFSTRNAQGHVVALRGGRALFDYTQSPIAPARLDPAFAWDQATISNYLVPSDFRPRAMFERFRYVVLHSSYPAVFDRVQAALADEAHVVARDDDWLVLESRILRTTKLDVPEPTVDADLADTLARRLSQPPQ